MSAVSPIKTFARNSFPFPNGTIIDRIAGNQVNV
jgi:hypothetical protein